MKIVILMGGRSAERAVSLTTGAGMAAALRRLGHDVLSLDAADGRVLPPGGETGAPALEANASSPETALVQVPAVSEAQAVVIALHGGAGENGTLQAVLDLARMPYTGSGMLASALAMDKAMSKRAPSTRVFPRLLARAAVRRAAARSGRRRTARRIPWW
jgi:D-alanine-D-alanine ligase